MRCPVADVCVCLNTTHGSDGIGCFGCNRVGYRCVQDPVPGPVDLGASCIVGVLRSWGERQMIRFLLEQKSCIVCRFCESCACGTPDDLGFVANYKVNPLHDECVFVDGKKVVLKSCDCHSRIKVQICQLLDPIPT